MFDTSSMFNMVVVGGRMARPSSERVLPSGTRLCSFDVSVKVEGRPAETVPVAWFDAPAWAAEVDVDASVVVAGRVRRRFYRVGGVVRSSTEVVADHVVLAGAGTGAEVRAVIAAVCCQLEEEALAASRSLPAALPTSKLRPGP